MDRANRLVGGATASIERAANAAKTALAGIASGLGGRELIAMVDQYAKFTAQLRLATDSQREFAQAYASVKAIANSSQADLSATGSLYAALARATKDLGLSQREVSDITESVNLALKVSGAGAQESAGAILQLSQAFASGVLRGDEFNSVNEASPRLMQAFADGIGVPVGALRDMAEQGQITSKVMADVLPKALADLRNEAKEVQTIAGGFTLLKNSALEFVGAQAQANGVVAAVANGLAVLANNLTLVAGAVMTIGAAKLATWLSSAASSAMSAAAANRAHAVATLAAAQANATATAQASLNANARLAEVRAAALASAGNIQLALTTNGLIPAQARAAAAAEAHTLAMQRLTVAQRAASLSATAASSVLGMLGGPLGALITVLGIAATAWTWYKSKQEEATASAAQQVQKSTGEIIASLDKENEKLRERIELAKKAGMAPIAQEGGEAAQRLAEISKLLDAEKALVAAGRGDAMQVINLTAVYNELSASIQRTSGSKTELANINAGNSISDWLAKNTQYLSEAERIQAALKKARDELKVDILPADIEKRIRASFGKQTTKDIESATKAAKEFIGSLEDERRAIGATEQQQRMMAAARAAAKAPTKELRLQIMETAVAVDRESQAWKDAEAARKAVEDAVGANAETMLQLHERARGLEREIELHGKTAEAAIMAEAAKVRATASSLAISEEYRDQLMAQVEQLERIAKLTAQKDLIEANAKAAEKATQDWQRAAERMEDAITDSLMRGFESGKSFAANMWSTIINMAKTEALTPFIKGIVGTGLGGLGFGSTASAATGGAAGGALGGIAGGLGIGGAMASIGTGAMQTAGALLTGQIGLGTTLSAGLSAIGTGTASGIMAGMSSVVGALGPIALGIGAAVTVLKKGFSMGPKEFTGEQTLNGSLGAGGFMGTLDAEWVKKGGWFRSDKNGVDRNAVGAEMSAGLTSAYDAIKASSADFARVLGINADSIASRSQAISIAMGKDEAANQKAIADFFVGVGNTIAGELLPEIAKFQAQGEAASATLQRLATGYSTIEQALWSIGMSFGAVGTASLEARERLLAAAGGLEAFAANTAGFQQNFLSEVERNAPVLKMVTEQMAALGYAAVDTRDEFKELFLSLNPSDEADGKLLASLLNIQAAFAQVYPAIDHAAIAAKDLADAQAKANEIAGERKGLQDELDTLTMTSAQLLAKQRDALDESNRALFDQIQGIKAQAAAVQAAKDRAANLLSGVDSMFSALQSVVGREKSLLEQSANAHRALSQALRGTLDSMSVAGNELESRQGARAQIQTALAIAKAGVLPDADSLKGALSVLSKDASSMFATQQDYLRDFYSTQNDIAALAGLTDDALSVEEKSLKALDGILESAQQQINALKGIDYSVLTLAQAISGFQGALGAAKADPVASAGGSIASLYRELLGRSADSAGLDYWQNAVAGGMSLDQVRKMIMEGSEYQLRGFAVGTNYVPTNMPAMIHEGERIIPAADNRELMRRLSSPSDNSAVLAAAVERLTATVARQQAVLDKIEESTRRNADMFEQSTAGGGPLLVEIAK